MPDPRSVLDAAQEAAGAGDHAAAERLLREALAMQEAGLGPRHPDLANTLNNLAVVCERREKVDEAERGYRRAHAIAVASLAPGHPFVADSLKNLVDFCVARGIPLWTPPVSSEVGAPSSTPAAPPRPERPVGAEVRPVAALVTRRVTRRVAAILALGVGSLLALLSLIAWPGSDASTETSSAVQDAPPSPSLALALTSATPASDATRGRASEPGPEPEPIAPPREPTARAASAALERDRPSGAAVTPVPVVVLTAQVCGAFERRGSPDWQCTPVNGLAGPGIVTFYTRLRTGSDTMVDHRWYHDDRLHQTMRLRVRASQGGGYRTFSRNTVGPDRAGDWKVELRTLDGTLLREEHFVVR